MKRQNGFTLVECVAGGIIIAIIAVTAIPAFHLFKNLDVTSERKLMAANYARETMERLCWDANFDPTPRTKDDAITDLNPLKGASNVKRSYTVSAASGGAPYTIITVSVTWD